MTERQRNSLRNLRRTLDDLSSAARLSAYKRAVPFVHVPIELFEQWATHADQLDRAEFHALFTADELEALAAFGRAVEWFRRPFADLGECPDVPDVLELPSWRTVMTAAATVRTALATAWRAIED